MEQNKLLSLLKGLIDKGIKISDIENEIGMPKNNLSGIIKGSKKLPKKWIQPLEDYINFGPRKMIELPKDFIGFDKIAILKADGSIEEIKTVDGLRQATIILNMANHDYKNIISEIDPKAGDMQVANKTLHEASLNSSPITDKPIYKYPLEEKDCYEEKQLEAQEQEIFKGYTFYETKSKKVKFEDAEDLIIEIMRSPNMKDWQKNMLKKAINLKFDFGN